jgi:hypothetical protein
MTLPGWNSLEAVKRISSGVEIVTLGFWVLLVAFEIVAHIWKKRAKVFNVLALIAFALAVSGEIINHQYNHQRETLYDAREQQLNDDANQNIRKAQDEAAAAAAAVASAQGKVGERDKTIQQLHDEVAATKRYSYIATLTFNGMVYTKGDVTMPTEISQAVEGTWYEPTTNRFRPVCDAAALQKSRDAIRQFPDFPFTYYELAYCLEKQGVPDWRSYAEKAVTIFEPTTAIGGHQKSHDEALAYLRQLLGKSK